MKPFPALKFVGARVYAAAFVLAAVACGVVEHPHGEQVLDGSNDFGPLAGMGVATPVAGASLGGGAGGLTSTGGAAGLAAVGGQAVVAGSAGAPIATAGSGGSASSSGGGGNSSTAGASGITINLGGVEVPKEKAIAFIHVGHSNMYGEATTPTASRAYHFSETHPHAYMYHTGSSPQLAIEPKTAGGPGAGPGTALVKESAVSAPDYYFISLGYAQPSAYCSQFLPGALYYDGLIAAPKAIKGRVTFGGIFIYLGITERHGSAADITGFADCINSLVTNIRKDVGEPNLPAVMNDYEVEATGEFVVGGAVANAIMPQIAKCPSVVSNFALVSAAGLGMQDDHHFNLDGQRTWAQRALQTMKDKGWSFWTQ
jgi:hypothetical protein